MNEDEWHRCCDPQLLWQYLCLLGRVTPYRLQRRWVACCQTFLGLLPEQNALVDELERALDNQGLRFCNLGYLMPIVEHVLRNIDCEIELHVIRNLYPYSIVTDADTAWLTADVISMARAIRERRDFSLMPMLADALQEAGCPEGHAFLSYCRQFSAPFVPRYVAGCWVLDWVLRLDFRGCVAAGHH